MTHPLLRSLNIYLLNITFYINVQASPICSRNSTKFLDGMIKKLSNPPPHSGTSGVDFEEEIFVIIKLFIMKQNQFKPFNASP